MRGSSSKISLITPGVGVIYNYMLRQLPGELKIQEKISIWLGSVDVYICLMDVRIFIVSHSISGDFLLYNNYLVFI